MLLSRCSLQNPITDNTDQPSGGAGNPPEVVSVYPDSAGLFEEGDSTIVVTFSDYMDPASFTNTNVKVSDTSGSSLAALKISYRADARKLFIGADHWAAGNAYLLTIVSDGVKNRFGVPLDGNHNRRPDGSPYDDFLWCFRGGANVAPLSATRPPVIWRIRPDTVGMDSLLPTIIVDFSVLMDTLTLKDGDAPKNIKLIRVADGSSIPLKLVLFSNVTVGVRPVDSLAAVGKYQVDLTSHEIKGDFPLHTPDYLRQLDAGNDGAQPNEPDYTWTFEVETLPPPEVSSETLTESGVEVDFSRQMDATTLPASNVQVSDADGYVPGSIVLTTFVPDEDTLATRLDYYFARPVTPPLQLLVSHRTRDIYGEYLDSNHNGIGGEPGLAPEGDDYQTVLQ